MNFNEKLPYIIFVLFGVISANGQQINDATTPLHLIQPDYPHTYGVPKVDDINRALSNVYEYLNESTPTILVNKTTGTEISDYTLIIRL